MYHPQFAHSGARYKEIMQGYEPWYYAALAHLQAEKNLLVSGLTAIHLVIK